jgi:hypothetical protein
MRGPRPFRIFLMGILALTPLAQAFWFIWAWRALGAVAWPGPRVLLQGSGVTAVRVVLAAGLDLLGVRVIPRHAQRPWGRAVARIWLIASCIGFLKERAPTARRSKSSEGFPVGHIDKPIDVADGVLYLASDEATFVTGTELSIDGGATAAG